MDHRFIRSAVFVLAAVMCLGAGGIKVHAEETATEIGEDKEELASAVLTEKENARKLSKKGSFATVGETGFFDIDREDTDSFDEDDLEILTRITWFSNDQSILTVDSSTGAFRGVAAGHTSVYVTGYADYKVTSPTGAVSYSNEELFKVTVNISVLPDLSNASFDNTEADIYVNAGGMAAGDEGVGCAKFVLTGTDYVFDEETDAGAISFSADTKNFSYEFSENVFTLYCTKAGDNEITAQIGPKTFEFILHVKKIKQKGSISKLIVKGKSTTLNLYQASESGGKAVKIDPSKITWKASNGRVTVNSKGKVKGKKLGATCIRGTYQGFTYYWVVNVSTAKKSKAIAAGRAIAKGTYSQPRRMQEGFYDCSSLVWRAYKPLGYNFGSNYYAPVAATEGKYLYDRGKMIDGAIGKENTSKLKLRPGDLFFEGGQNNGRWNGIYHVEMFAGYSISYIDSVGKPVYMNTWVNRPDGNYGYGTSTDYVGRP